MAGGESGEAPEGQDSIFIQCYPARRSDLVPSPVAI